MIVEKLGYNHTHGADFHIDRPSGGGNCLLLLIKTHGIFTLGGVDTEVEPNSFILYDSITPQHYRAADCSYTDDWIHFTFVSEEREIFDNLGIPFNTPVCLGDVSKLSAIVKTICFEHRSANERKDETIDLYMRILFTKISERMTSKNFGNPQSENPYYEKLLILRNKIYITAAFDESIDDMADGLSMSRSNFQHTYKSIFGVSVISDIIAARLERAAYLLTSTEMSVRSIAESCGYHSDVHFMRQFKSRYKTTPSLYRRTG